MDAPLSTGSTNLLTDARSRLDRVTARAAYQAVLYARATLVDIRPLAQQANRKAKCTQTLAPVVIERNVLEWRLDPRHPSSLPVAAST